jgi:hypothetical protein
MSSHRNNSIHWKNNAIDKRSTASGVASTTNKSKPSSSKSNKNDTQLKAKSTVTTNNPQTKTDSYNLQSIEDTYIPSIQNTQLNKQDEIASVSYADRLLKIMAENGITCQPVNDHGQLDLRVTDSQVQLIICTGVTEKGESLEKCTCNKYFPNEFEICGSACHFCNHSVRFHRVKPEREQIVFDDMRSESERNEYKYWFDKFIELQRLYCSIDKNFSFDDNLFIKIFDKSRQAILSFIQSPNYRYVLIKYTYECVYDEGERLFETKYQIICLQTILPIKTDEPLRHSCSYYQYHPQTEYGFRPILWDLNQPATLIATELDGESSHQPFIKRIVNIQCPNIINDNNF